MQIERGLLGTLPYAAIGSGPPLVVLSGLAPVAGEVGDSFVRSMLGPFGQLSKTRRIFVLNRRANLPGDLTMARLAAEHADALRAGLDVPVDVAGMSTGGSIAQQLAADHSDIVDRLALICTACRLGPLGKSSQADAARQLRAGRSRAAIAGVAGHLVPRGFRTLARLVGAAAAHRLLTSPTAVPDLVATLDAEDEFDLARCAQPIRARTLIIGGQRDRFYSVDLFEETAKLIDNSELLIVPNRGHIGALGDKTAIARLTEFFTRCSDPPTD